MSSIWTHRAESEDIGFRMRRDVLTGLDDEEIERFGKEMIGMLKRRRGMLLCERDGHLEPGRTWYGMVCGRCGLVVRALAQDAVEA